MMPKGIRTPAFHYQKKLASSILMQLYTFRPVIPDQKIDNVTEFKNHTIHMDFQIYSLTEFFSQFTQLI